MDLPSSNAKLFSALCQFQSKVKSIPKTGNNPHFRSSYAELDVACNYLFPLLSASGLSVTQLAYVNGEWLMLKTVLAHVSGEKVESEWPVVKMGAKPQEIGSATSYARRYSLFAITGLTAELEDDDAEVATNRSAPAPRPAPKNYAPQPQAAPSTTAAEVPMPPSQGPSHAGLSLKQVNRMYAIAKANKWPVAFVQAYVKQTYKAIPEKLSRQAYEQACDYFANAIFDDSMKSILKDSVPSVTEQFEKAKKSYVDHTKEPSAPQFNDDEPLPC
jgi:hypothetical protein